MEVERVVFDFLIKKTQAPKSSFKSFPEEHALRRPPGRRGGVGSGDDVRTERRKRLVQWLPVALD